MEKKRKVLVLSNVASMIAQFNMRNIKILQDLGFHVDVACNFKEGNTCSDDVVNDLVKDFEDKDIGYFQVDFKRNVGSLVALKESYNELDKLAKTTKYDLIFCQSTIGGIVGRLIGKKYNIHVIYIAHGFQFYKGCSAVKWLTIYPIELYLSKYTTTLITTNIEDDNLAKEKFHAQKSVYVPGVGIDLKKYNVSDVDIKRLREEWEISDSDYLIISAGELSKRKNHATVIKAIAKMRDARIKYFICGQGELEEELKHLIAREQLDEQVRLLGYRKDLLEIVSMSDLFCFPSFSEGLPVSLMMAIALKRNVICSDIRGNNDLILDNRYRFNPGNVDDVINHILFAKNNYEQSFVDNNYIHLQNFSSEMVDKQMKNIFAES